jgi:hypothetical protein
MHNHALHPSLSLSFAMWSLLLACGTGADDESRERCDDVSAQIDEALQRNIDQGVLAGTAIACELTPESFDPRVQRADRDYLLNAYQNACATQAQECSGIPTHAIPPPSAPPPPPNLPPPSPSTSP